MHVTTRDLQFARSMVRNKGVGCSISVMGTISPLTMRMPFETYAGRRSSRMAR